MFIFLLPTIHGLLLTVGMVNMPGCRNWMDTYKLGAHVNYPKACDFIEKMNNIIPCNWLKISLL